jgi:hypothetical protein
MTSSLGGAGESEPPRDDSVDLVALAHGESREGAEGRPAEQDELLNEAYDLCRELPARCLARPAYGDFAFALARASRLYDLVFVGRDVASGPGRYAAAARTARRVAASASCAVAIAPRDYGAVRSAVVVCPMSDAGARALRTAAELATLLQVKLEALVVSGDPDLAGRWTRDVKRYLVDHDHSARVLAHKPPLAPHLDNLVAGRESPLIVVPKGSPLGTLLQRDPLADALKALAATIVVQP